jgi:FkbM family methyltransferase
MTIKQRIRRRLWDWGYELSGFSREKHVEVQRRHILRAHRIDLVLDVGANTGQFAHDMRERIGYAGRIVSFEPLHEAFAVLQRDAAADPLWDAWNYGLGDRAGFSDINVAGNSVSSSLLEMLPAHASAAPESVYTGTQRIEIRTLDDVAASVIGSERNVYMKLDTQGFEKHVLDGAKATLPRIGMLQIEMSLVPLYAGGSLLPELDLHLAGLGYRILALEPGYADPRTGQLLQLDAIYRRLDTP